MKAVEEIDDEMLAVCRQETGAEASAVSDLAVKLYAVAAQVYGLYAQADACYEPNVKLNDLTFSLSGMENQVKALAEEGEKPANIARFAIDAISNVVWRTTREAQKRYPGLPVLCSGGVASNTQLRAGLISLCGALFAEPRYSTDNAMGTAILTWRAVQAEGRL